MSTTFAAHPGTYIVEREPGPKTSTTHSILTPVIAFTHLDTGMVFPLLATPYGGLTRGRALMTPDGFVTDPSVGLVFTSLTEWEALVDKPAYAKMAMVHEVLPPKAGGFKVEHNISGPSNDAIAIEHEQTTGRLPDKPKGKPQVFQTTSFWQALNEAGDTRVSIFNVIGGAEAPAKNDKRFVKIKRDEYMAMKKVGTPVRDPRETTAPEGAEPDPNDLI